MVDYIDSRILQNSFERNPSTDFHVYLCVTILEASGSSLDCGWSQISTLLAWR